MDQDTCNADYDRVERSLTNHPPNADQQKAIAAIRSSAKNLGAVIVFDQPPSRERSIALTKLEETVMWAIKGIVLADDDAN